MAEPLHPTCIEVTNLHVDRQRTYLCGPDCPKPAGPDPERDARIDVYRDRERRRAARDLDRYMELIYDEDIASKRGAEIRVAGERFVEACGDYVLARMTGNPWGDAVEAHRARLQQKSHYGVSIEEHNRLVQEEQAELIDRQRERAASIRGPHHSADYVAPDE